MTTLPTHKGKTQYEVQRETLEFVMHLAEEISVRYWVAYKKGSVPERANPYYEGKSDGAEEVQNAIRALIPTMAETNHDRV
jgi:hypothetical protein